MNENLITSELIENADQEASNLLGELEKETSNLSFSTASIDNICDIIKQIENIISRVITIIRWIPLPPVKKVVKILEKLLELLRGVC
ncbi:MAG: hypothetical protein RLN81_15645 [Balneolaceae bacterium]